jgi:hypothetical protein
MIFNASDVVTVDFPGITGIKRRPALVLSSATYHAARPDIIIGLNIKPAIIDLAFFRLEPFDNLKFLLKLTLPG